MSTTAIISCAIAVAGFIISILGTMARLSVRFGKMEQRVAENESRDKEEREKTRVKFERLYHDVNVHNTAIATLSTKIDSMAQTVADTKTEVQHMNLKLDKMIERLYGATKCQNLD
ncbi:hypothetical protein [Treponema sp.]|uniref:hypothetical protein n=1 Tax=Treponema sp. TaxID=166 RepID=UPI003FD88BE1